MSIGTLVVVSLAIKCWSGIRKICLHQTTMWAIRRARILYFVFILGWKLLISRENWRIPQQFRGQVSNLKKETSLRLSFKVFFLHSILIHMIYVMWYDHEIFAHEDMTFRNLERKRDYTSIFRGKIIYFVNHQFLQNVV